MKICLDLRYKTDSGASSYINNLVPLLLKLDTSNSYVFIKYPEQNLEFDNLADKIILSPSGNYITQLIWDFFILSFKLKGIDLDIYHPLKNPGAVWGKYKKIFTVHSINVAYKGIFPTTLKRHLYHTLYTNYFTKKCTKVIAVSDFIEKFIKQKLKINKTKINVIYHGIDEKFKIVNKNTVEYGRAKYQFPKNYILSVGNITPVKNHLTTIKAFAAIANKIEENYVIVGSRKNTYFKTVLEFVKKENLSDRINFPGFVGSDDLPAIMTGAKLLLFPSLTEGCPVTMLEAFACGLPIVASKRGGLWDLGKHCAIFVDDPMNAESFSKNILTLLESDKLRNKLSRLSFLKAQEFSWKKAALSHINTYGMCKE
jgi:glycosyltransferase involved in cell wall biosynthesis